MGILIINTARKTKRLKAGIGVLGNVAELIVIDALSYGAVNCIDDQPWTAEVIAYNAVGDALFGHIIGHVRLRAVDKAGDDVAAAVQLRYWSKLILVKKALR